MADSRELQILLTMKDKMSGSLAKADKQLSGFGNKIKSITPSLKTMAIGVAALGTSAVVAGKKFVDLASDAEETQNKFASVFGEMTADAEKFADDLGRAVGRNVTDIKNGLSAYEGFSVGLGLSRDKAYEMATQLQSLSIDFASFNNLSDGEAQTKFLSAMSGSAEVLRPYGINLLETTVQQKALEMGLAATTSELTQADKATARYAIIMETMGEQGAVGDAVKTAGSYANQVKAMQSNLKTLGEEIGRVLIPIFSQFVQAINVAINWVRQMKNQVEEGSGRFSEFIEVVKVLAQQFLEAVTPAILGFWEQLQPLLPYIKELAKFLGTVLAGSLIIVVKIIQTGLVVAFRTFQTVLYVVNSSIEYFKNLWDGIVVVIKTVIDWVAKLINKLKELKNAMSIGGIASGIASAVLPGRANGGSVAKQRPYMVGENGPELFVPSSSGRIIPNNKMSGGGNTVVNVTVNGDVSGRELVEKVSEQLMGKLRLNTPVTI